MASRKMQMVEWARWRVRRTMDERSSEPLRNKNGVCSAWTNYTLHQNKSVVKVISFQVSLHFVFPFRHFAMGL